MQDDHPGRLQLQLQVLLISSPSQQVDLHDLIRQQLIAMQQLDRLVDLRAMPKYFLSQSFYTVLEFQLTQIWWIQRRLSGQRWE